MTKYSDYNTNRPLIMYIDLNSCFATIEQQSRPRLRGRPVAIVNRATENTSIVTASYEAKARGVTVGMKFYEAKRLVPDLIGLESDPPKYRFVYHKLLAIMQDYSSQVVMKSIDEGMIDFGQSPKSIAKRNLEDIGYEIKQRLRDEIGSHMRCNIGIGTNRFLAKTAADLHKPDGLDIITADNLRLTLGGLKLQDLTGIAKHNEARLNAVGIYTPLEFLDADLVALEKIVFKSVVGRWWYKRLRGWEVDDKIVTTKTIGRQYVLERRDLKRVEIAARLHNLCESVGYRLRCQLKVARGIYVYVKTSEHQYWHASQLCQLPFFSDQTINLLAQQLFLKAPEQIIEIGVHLYELEDDDNDQISLFNDQLIRQQNLVGALDGINQRFGDRTIHAASTLETKSVKAKIPFGSTRYL
jgi:DNA polymerase-4